MSSSFEPVKPNSTPTGSHCMPGSCLSHQVDPALWFALRVRGRFEKTVVTLLEQKGYESFLPLYKSRHRWSDRYKELDLPLFPGYVFCRFRLMSRLPIVKTNGVLHIVGIGRNPVPVEESEISAIQQLIKAGVPAQPWSFLRIGQDICIERGPLVGLKGKIVSLGPRHRLVVSVSLLQRSVAAEIDSAWVSPLKATVPGSHITVRSASHQQGNLAEGITVRLS
jgi:transcription antitermination factor NusG